MKPHLPASVTALSARRRMQRRCAEARPRLLRLAWSWCHDRDLAEDLVQETCARALERAGQLRDPERLLPWMTRILANVHRDWLRARREVPLEELEPVDALVERNGAEREEAVARVHRAMAALTDEHRKVVTLVDLMGFSYAEVADALEVPVGTVMSRLGRARDRLRTALDPGAEAPRPRLRRVQ